MTCKDLTEFFDFDDIDIDADKRFMKTPKDKTRQAHYTNIFIP